MHHSLKIKILDLDHIESIVEQDITDVEAEKIVGGTLSVSKNKVAKETSIIVNPPGSPVGIAPLPDPPHCAWLLVEPINLLNEADWGYKSLCNLKYEVVVFLP
ncbi:hypothetical protein LC612_06905 [Nostoc sp. CHAB 5834]|nr:hypothetical protein [Nostoc sp. CHAB 5834]